jgi:hypothetical protein
MNRDPSILAILLVLALCLLLGCASPSVDPGRRERPEKGPDGTVAYMVQVEASEPGVRIEADGDYIGVAPCTVKIFADRDGTFHNFGRFDYVLRAIPSGPGQDAQTKVFRTGGWFTEEDRVPRRVFFDMNARSSVSGGTGAAPPSPNPGGAAPKPQ